MSVFALRDDGLLNAAEREAYAQALAAIGDRGLVVCPKVRLSQIAKLTASRRNFKAHRAVDEAVIDLLVCDQATWKPVAAVLVGDDGHPADAAGALAGLGLAVVRTGGGGPADVAAALRDALP